MNKFWFFVFAAVLLFAACGEKEKPGPGGKTDSELTGVNKFMRDNLEDWYYWNDALTGSPVPSNSLEFGDFLRASLVDLALARDVEKSGAVTMDGGYRADGSRYIYSRIDRMGITTRASASEQYTYGFGVIVVPYNSSDRLSLLVTWTQPGGPADKAGLKRGMWLDEYNGEYFTRNNLDAFAAHLFSQGSSVLKVADDDGTDYSIPGELTRIDPILHHDVIDTDGGKKVGYLLYNAFEQGTIVADALGEFDLELRDVFGEFKSAGVNELVLDLRYNGGGAVRSSQLLSSLAGDVTERDVFIKMLYNRHTVGANPMVWYFMEEPNSLALDKVYVLVTGETASSSELFVNALRGVGVEVVLVGERTEGKNVGMNLLEFSEGPYRYEFWPITFKNLNAQDFSDYSDGFAPTVQKDELWTLFVAGENGFIYPLGDPRERLLDAALTMIDGGTVSADVYTRGGGGAGAFSLSNPRKGGSRVYESPEAL